MRRRAHRSDVRVRLAAEDRELWVRYGRPLRSPALDRQLLRRAEAIEAGLPVIVQHGYEIDMLPPMSGPFVVEPDGSVALVEPVCVDTPGSEFPTVLGYRRPDGSMV